MSSQLPEAKPHPLIRSFGRRKSKGMRQTRENALETVMATAEIKLPDGDGAVDPASFFATKPQEIWFEIGFGNGEHVLAQAERNPHVGVIGCEPFINGVAALCVGVEQAGAENIRIWPDDARVLMARFPDQSLDRLFLLHADPWPKARHHKRRFIQTETLDEIARLLKPGAELRMATDHPGLAEWLLEKTEAHPAFEGPTQKPEDRMTPPADWPETRYGKKGIKQGRPPVYFIFKRR